MATLAAPGVSATARSRSDVTDHDLVEAVRAGDDHAFERLYERYHRRIATYIFGMVRDRGRAEDLTQEVFVSALRRMRQTDRAIQFKPWIYEIAKNACIDAFRRTRRTEEVSFDAELEAGGGAEAARLAAPATAVPDAAVEGKQRLDHLWGAFDGLSDAHHQILVMRELEGLSYAEIGDRLGMSKASVESTLFRARRRLTEEFEELQTGAACQRVLGIISDAEGSSGALGRRDQRRVGQHISRCTPCRREAVMAGLDAAAMARRPIRTKIGALLPLPAFLKRRWLEGADAQVAQWSVAASSYGDAPAGWLKAVAAVAAVALAGAGAGEVVTGHADERKRPAAVAPSAGSGAHGGAAGAGAAPVTVKRAAGAKAGRVRGAGTASGRTRVVRTAAGERSTGSAQRQTSAGRDGSGAGSGGGSGSSGSTGAGGADGAGSAATTRPASSGGGSTAGSGSGSTTTSSGGSQPLVAPNPSALTQPSSDPAPTTVGQVVEGTTDRIGDAVGGAVGGAVQSTGATVGSTVDATTEAATGTVKDTVGVVDNTVKGVTSGATRTVQTTTQTTGETVDGVTSTLGAVVGGLGGR